MKYSALIGNPVDHSVSPAMFDYVADKLKIEYAHLKINVPSEKDLLSYLKALTKVGFCGVNVTIPYKVAVVKYMDFLDNTAVETKTVNTIKFVDEKLYGYNTDGIAAVQAIEHRLLTLTSETNVLLIGAGGAARAIICELYKRTKNIVVMNRFYDEAKNMIALVSEDIPIRKLIPDIYHTEISKADLVINATSVGMYPNNEEKLFSSSILSEIPSVKNKCFFDAIFNPYETRFLSNAAQFGAKTCSGLYMMIYQILLAFSIWTGLKITDIDVDSVNEKLKEDAFDLM